MKAPRDCSLLRITSIAPGVRNFDHLPRMVLPTFTSRVGNGVRSKRATLHVPLREGRRLCNFKLGFRAMRRHNGVLGLRMSRCNNGSGKHARTPIPFCISDRNCNMFVGSTHCVAMCTKDNTLGSDPGTPMTGSHGASGS